MNRSAAVLAAAALLAVFRLESAPAGALVHVDLTPAPGITTAALDYRKDVPVSEASGIVVLLPGSNGNGAFLLNDTGWTEFARDNKFVLAALTFVSDEDDLREERGYYDAAAGSGEIAAAALKSIGAGRLPVFMYGFSGGAHFTASFAQRFPSLLRGWCAASFEARERPKRAPKPDAKSPPGIIACGSEDSRIGAALALYGIGRKAGRRLTWVEVPDLGHERSPALEAFTRRYFLALKRKQAGIWLDVGSGEDVVHSATTAKALQTWLPDKSLVDEWRALSARKSQGVIEHVEKTKVKGYEQLTMFLSLPPGGKADGVMCMSMLARSPIEVREQIRGDKAERYGRLMQFATENNLAIVAWGSHRLWDPNRNWDELSKTEAKKCDADFDLVAKAWDAGISFFVRKYGIPSSGYLMTGFSGSAQYAQRLAMRRPDRFLAIHIHVASSFDVPTKGGSSILWCVTTGENELGYERSRRFFSAARDLDYPIVYKAYPGLGHEGNEKVVSLGLACFRYALREYSRATRLNGGKPTKPDWVDIFTSSLDLADIFNQAVYSKFDYLCVPTNFRMLLPAPSIRDAWIDE